MEDILKMRRILTSEPYEVQQTAVTRRADKSITIALVLGGRDLVLWKCCDDPFMNPIIKWIPWLDVEEKRIQSVSFRPTDSLRTTDSNLPTLTTFEKSRLLLTTRDGYLHIIPSCSVLSSEKVVETDTRNYEISYTCPVPDLVPTAVVWWIASNVCCYDQNKANIHKNVAIVGSECGRLLFFSLSKGHCVALLKTGSSCPIFSLVICNDHTNHVSHLLVTNDLRQQWKLPLEKKIGGKIGILIRFSEGPLNGWKEDMEEEVEENTAPHSRTALFQGFRQRSLNAFASFRNRIRESRRRRRASLNSHLEVSNSSEMDQNLLEPCDCYGDALLTVQTYQGNGILTGLFIPESVLLLFDGNKPDEKQLLKYKLNVNPLVTTLLLTDTFIYIADMHEAEHRILVFSTKLAKISDATDSYNQNSFVQSFIFQPGERIVFLSNMTGIMALLGHEMPKPALEFLQLLYPERKNDFSVIRKEWQEACLVITNKAVYRIEIRENLWNMCAKSYNMDETGVAVSKLCSIFDICSSGFFQVAAEMHLKAGRVEKVLPAYEMAGKTVHSDLVKHCFHYNGVYVDCFEIPPLVPALKLASHGYPEVLLKYYENGSYSASPEEKNHLETLAFLAHVERVLIHDKNEKMALEFKKFLFEKRSYNLRNSLEIFGSMKMFSYLRYMMEWRGVRADVASVVFGATSDVNFDRLSSEEENAFWDLFADENLIDCALTSAENLKKHAAFSKKFADKIPSHILMKLWHFYVPTRLISIPIMQKGIDANKIWGEEDENAISVKEWVTCFIFLHALLFDPNPYEARFAEYVCEHLDVMKKEEGNVIRNVGPLISGGNTFACAVRNGKLWSWGDTSYGCLGRGSSVLQEPAVLPGIVDFFSIQNIRVLQVSCGRHHTLALTEAGVYAWGSSKFGQLGLGTTTKEAVDPHFLNPFSDEIIIYINAGQYHSLAVDLKGRLFSWGWGVYGQLGHGGIENVSRPKRVCKLENEFVKSAQGGQAHTIVLTIKGEIWAFGCGTFGQLGIGSNKKCTSPIKLFGIQKKITCIATKYFHNIACCEDGRIYKWGCSPKILGQLMKEARQASLNSDTHRSKIMDMPGFGKHLSPTLVDTSLIEDYYTYKQLSCGSEHNVLVTTKGHCFAWGRNGDCQLGDFVTTERVNPKVMNPLEEPSFNNCVMKELACGRDFTIGLDDQGHVFGCGNNRYAQLGCFPKEFKLDLKNPMMAKGQKIPLVGTHMNKLIYDKSARFVQILPAMDFPRAGDDVRRDRIPKLKGVINLPTFVTPEAVPFMDLDKMSRGEALHYALERFHTHYHLEPLVHHFTTLKNYQALSKLCLVNERYFFALYFQLKAATDFSTQCLPECLKVFRNYTLLAVQSREKFPRDFLKQSICAWISFHLPVTLLEFFFDRQDDDFKLNLAQILFGTSMRDDAHSIPVWETRQGEIILPLPEWDLPDFTSPSYCEDEILKKFSTNFTLKLAFVALDGISQGKEGCDEFLKLLNQAVFFPSVVPSCEEWKPNDSLKTIEKALSTGGGGKEGRQYVHIPYSELPWNDDDDDVATEMDFASFTCGHSFGDRGILEGKIRDLSQLADQMMAVVGNGESVEFLVKNAYACHDSPVSYHPVACPDCARNFLMACVQLKSVDKSDV